MDGWTLPNVSYHCFVVNNKRDRKQGKHLGRRKDPTNRCSLLLDYSEEVEVLNCTLEFTGMTSGMENVTDDESATCWTVPDDNNIPDGRILGEININKSCLPFPSVKFLLRVTVENMKNCNYIPIAYPYPSCDDCMHLCRVVNDRAMSHNYCDLKCDCQSGYDKCPAYIMTKMVKKYLTLCDIQLIC